MHPKYGKNNHVRNNCVKKFELVRLSSMEILVDFVQCVRYARISTRAGRLARNVG